MLRHPGSMGIAESSRLTVLLNATEESEVTDHGNSSKLGKVTRTDVPLVRGN